MRMHKEVKMVKKQYLYQITIFIPNNNISTGISSNTTGIMNNTSGLLDDAFETLKDSLGSFFGK
jgi:hypothetical protein